MIEHMKILQEAVRIASQYLAEYPPKDLPNDIKNYLTLVSKEAGEEVMSGWLLSLALDNLKIDPDKYLN